MNDYEFRLEAMLADALDAVLYDGLSVDEALARYPQAADELRPLLQVMVMTAHLKAPEMPADRVDALESRLVAQMETTRRPRSSQRRARLLRFPTSRVGKLAAAIAIVFLLAFGGGGAAVQASANTVPGDTLYTVKRLWEAILLALAPLTGDEDDLWLRFAQERLEELLLLEQNGRLDVDALNDLYEASAKSIALADAETAPAVTQFAQEARASLRNLSPAPELQRLIRDVDTLLEPTVDTDGTFIAPTHQRPPSLSATVSPTTATATPSPTMTFTQTPSTTPSATATTTATPSPTDTATAGPTRTPLVPPTETDTPTPTDTATLPPSPTHAPTATLTPLPLPVRPTDVPHPTATDRPRVEGGGDGDNDVPSSNVTPRVRDTQFAVTLTRAVTPPPTDPG
ncbi:MAG: hypothetical protein D6737_13000 [Chloroflexi bacterium]|nr:MAG: hypothetical protein D6737_13000 [Chloroflexota bacterium]